MRNKATINCFLHKVDDSNPGCRLPYEIFKEAGVNIEHTYKYQIKRIFTGMEYYSQMKPSLINELTYELFERQYLNYRNFFYDRQLDFEGNDYFISRILSSLESIKVKPGDNLINRGDKFEALYFIEQGSVVVASHKTGIPLAYLPTYGYFGDYQILLDTGSNVSFSASLDGHVFCFTLDKDIFIDLLNQYPNHYQFFKERALATRRLYKRL